MKRYKYVKIVLYNNGYTDSIPTNLTLVDIDADGYLVYNDENDENGDIVKGRYDTSSSIPVDSNTTSITYGDTGITMSTGETYQIDVLNQNSLNVTTECTFEVTAGTSVTVSSAGVITAATIGTSTVTITHNDGPTGTIEVVVS